MGLQAQRDAANQAVDETAAWFGGDDGPVQWVNRVAVIRDYLAALEALVDPAQFAAADAPIAGAENIVPPDLLETSSPLTEPLAGTPEVSSDSGLDGNSAPADAQAVDEATSSKRTKKA